ncbi:MAG: efflux transporter outer membrane subunit [Phycisphaeraceae bacterium]|nr:efflux transporter outer membrane subunit [Phycisphaeraceae bacterium]
MVTSAPAGTNPMPPCLVCNAPWPALVAACLSLGGCMVGPHYTPPNSNMPPRYGERADSAATVAENMDSEECAWWHRFGDEELASLVERAIATNNSLKAAEARVRQARSAREVARSLLYPRIGVGASALRFRGSESAIGLPDADLEGSFFQIGFDAEWTIDLFGGTRRLVESTRAQEQVAESRRRGVVLMIAAETARAYMELRGAQRQLEVALATLSDQRETLRVTEDRHSNGLASNLEVVRARTEVERTAAEIPPIEQAIRQYIHILSTLMALEPTALSDELVSPSILPVVPDRIAVGVPSDLLRRRPDIQAAERHIASATAMIGVATAQLFPQLILGASGGFSSRRSGDLFNGNSATSPSTYYLAGPAINWTLFDAGRRRATIRISEAEVDAARALYEDTVLAAFREVESALVAVDRDRARVTDLERLSASAREVMTIAQGDYRNGLLDQLTVLDAQRQASRADMLLVQGQVALMVSVVRLYKALGGGWEFAEPVPPHPSAWAGSDASVSAKENP